MHYKNGREAREGDPVVYYDNYRQRTITGIAHSFMASTETCNCQVSTIIPGAVITECKTVGEIYHAEDTLLAIDPEILEPK